MKTLNKRKLKFWYSFVGFSFVLMSQAVANDLSENLKNIQVGQCNYKGKIQGDITQSKFGASKFLGDVQVKTSVKKQGEKAFLKFKLTSEAKVIDLGAKMFMTIEENSNYDIGKGTLSQLEVKTLLKARKFLLEKVIKNNFIKAQFNQIQETPKTEDQVLASTPVYKTEMILESSKGNYTQILPQQSFASVTFPMFHLSKLSNNGENKIVPVIKFNNVSNVYLPEVVDQNITLNPITVEKEFTNSKDKLQQEQQSAKAQSDVKTPLYLYGLNTHDPVQITMDPETHQFKEIKMKLIFEVNGTKKEPLEFYIVAQLNSENCKSEMSAQNSNQEEDEEDSSDE